MNKKIKYKYCLNINNIPMKYFSASQFYDSEVKTCYVPLCDEFLKKDQKQVNTWWYAKW